MNLVTPNHLRIIGSPYFRRLGWGHELGDTKPLAYIAVGLGSQTFIAKITFESIPNQLRIIEYNRKLSLARVSSIE